MPSTAALFTAPSRRPNRSSNAFQDWTLGVNFTVPLGLRQARAASRQLDVVIARDIETTGNTSAASIPLATERLLREGLVPHGGLALQIGFGAGLSYAAQVIRLP